jgi:hypothetical protein
LGKTFKLSFEYSLPPLLWANQTPGESRFHLCSAGERRLYVSMVTRGKRRTKPPSIYSIFDLDIRREVITKHIVNESATRPDEVLVAMA